MYPIGIHFGISQIVGGTALMLIQRYGGGMETYYQNSILLVGLSGLLAILPALYLYRRDREARVVGGLAVQTRHKACSWWSILLLLCMGAAMSQFGNLIVAFLQLFLKSSAYQETFSKIMDGKGMMEMVYWMGIVAPVAEEAVFRWLVYLRLRDYLKMPAAALISALLFGAYHGNLVQFLYASLLGFLFAYFMEMTGSLSASVFLHIGANIWSLVYSEFGIWLLQASAGVILMGIHFLLLLVLLGGFRYYTAVGQNRKIRCI